MSQQNFAIPGLVTKAQSIPGMQYLISDCVTFTIQTYTGASEYDDGSIGSASDFD